jgi:hypothetical protein
MSPSHPYRTRRRARFIDGFARGASALVHAGARLARNLRNGFSTVRVNAPGRVTSAG